MKVNIQKLTRVIPCFIAVFAIMIACSVQAFATAQYIDPYKYITSIESNGNIETVHILFDGVQPLHRLVAAGNDFTTVSDVTFAVTPGVTTAAIASWQNGVISSDNQPAPDGAIRVAEIMSGTTMVIKSDFGFSWDHSSSRVGGSFDWSYQCFVRCYDANGNYMTKISGERLSGTESMAGGSTVTRDYEYSFVLPSGCTFICPSSNFTMYPRITSEEEWRVDFIYHSNYFGMSITRDALAAGSQNNQAVVDKMDDLINGNPEDNQAAQNGANEAQGAIGDLNNAGNAMDSVPKPEVNINSMIPSDLASQIYMKYTNVIGALWQSEVLARMMSILGCFIFLSFLLYGKKG